MEAAAEWALIIAKFNDDDLRIIRTEAWVAFGGDFITGIGRLSRLRRFNNWTGGLLRRYGSRSGGCNSCAASPGNIANENANCKSQYNQNRVK
ncbi:hypothetical protein [Candidatus Villigracilis proximus]|uniref:hypothetical protein n=1 Tax=Candidatus Villigracilis proximus TaxID=3140683 RepID=UPI0031E5A055